MRTVIFVYQSTSIDISTCETDLELCSLDTNKVSLSAGQNPQSITPGVYKIVSYHDVHVTGDTSTFEVVTANKDDPPTPPPDFTTKLTVPLDMSALDAFLTEPDAKDLLHP